MKTCKTCLYSIFNISNGHEQSICINIKNATLIPNADKDEILAVVFYIKPTSDHCSFWRKYENM